MAKCWGTLRPMDKPHSDSYLRDDGKGTIYLHDPLKFIGVELSITGPALRDADDRTKIMKTLVSMINDRAYEAGLAAGLAATKDAVLAEAKKLEDERGKVTITLVELTDLFKKAATGS